MKKVVLIPDSFKGTLSSLEVCTVMAERVRARFPDCEIVSVPVADGGEGSVDAFLEALGGEKRSLEVSGPFFEPLSGFYGLLDGGKTAVIEMAACAGLAGAEGKLDPSKTTTYGVGQLFLDAAARGAKKILVGLGGSCTNDGGCGAAAACGVMFFKADGEAFVPVGGTLAEIARIDLSGRSALLEGVEFVSMCDVDNPVYGPNGAAYVFAPQKGADGATVRALDEGLQHLCGIVRRDLGLELAELPGGGAAGGMGAGMVAFFGSALRSGIETVLEAVSFDELIADADLIFTGEGKLDSQSLRGKAVVGVARRAKQQGKAVIAVVGGAESGMEPVYEDGVKAVFPINRLPQALSLSRLHAKENLAFTMDNVLRLL